MSTHKNINKICVVVTVLAIIFTILFMNGKKLGLTSMYDEDAEAYEDSAYFTANDQKKDWDESSATFITLDGSDIKISGNGAYVYENNVVISGGGYYVISGSLDDGSIVVDAYNSSKVFIKLKGVDIYCSDDACLRVDQADKVFLTLAKGTVNSFESGEEYSDEALEDGTGGAIFAHDDLTINGTGSLTVTANYKHGIDANDDLIITGGNIDVYAPKDGIHVNDSIRIKNADILVSASDDGVVTSKEGGFIYMESGTLDITSSDDGIHATGDVFIDGGEISITAGDDGIHSDTNVTINDGYINIPQCYEGIEAITIDVAGGEIEIYPSDDGLNANGGSGDMFGMGGMQGGMDNQNGGMGGPGGGFDPSSMTDSEQSSETESSSEVVNSQSGESDSNSDATKTQSSEFRADNNDIQSNEIGSDTEAGDTQSSEAENDSTEQVQDNEADTDASDTNADTRNNQMGPGGGNMQPPDMQGGMMNQNSEDGNTSESTSENITDISGDNMSADASEDSSEDEETYINISGGKITIINENGQDADGLDSNGSIFITGGEVYVSLSGNGTNNAIDYGSENNGICEISGGTVIACGGNGMVEEISDTSAQCSIMYNLSTTIEGGNEITLTDSDGNQLISYEVPCSFSSVVISTPEMKQNETYTLTMGDTTEEITTESIAGTYGEAVSTMGGIGGMQGGNMQGGMQDGNMQGGRPDGGMRGGRMFDQNNTSEEGSTDDSQENGNSQNADGSAQTDINAQNADGSAQTDINAQNADGSAQTDINAQNGDSNAQTDMASQNADGSTAADASNQNTGENQGFGGPGGVPPDMNGDQNFQPGQNMNGQDSTTEASTEDDTVTYSSQKEVTSDEWIWLGAAVGVLVLGLLAAVLYKRW